MRSSGWIERGILPLLVMVLAGVVVGQEAVIEVAVVGEDGKPRPGARVELIQVPEGAKLLPFSRVWPRRMVAGEAFVLQGGESDAKGELTLRQGADGTRAAVRAWLAGHPRALAPAFSLESRTHEVRLVLVAGATLKGRLGPREILALEPRLNLRRRRDGALFNPFRLTDPPGLVEQFGIGRDGAFEIRGLPAGEWDVRWRDRKLAEVRLEKGRLLERDLDARHLLPGPLVLRLVVDEGLPGITQFNLAHDLPGEERYTGGGTQMNASGVFHMRAVLAGTYRVVVRTNAPEDSGMRVLRHPEVFEVRSGRPSEKTIHFRNQRLRVRVVQKDGATPLGNAEFDARGEFCNLRVTSDAEGLITFFPAPQGPFDLRLGDTSVARLQMPPGQTAAERVVKLPH